jgi:DNA primase small subunit
MIPADVTMTLGYPKVFRERVARSFEALSEEKLLEVKGIRKPFADKLIREKARALELIRRGKLEELSGLAGMGPKTLRQLLEFLTRANSEFTDGKVTIDTKRILRLPSSLHSGVSMKCMLIRDIDRFGLEDAVPKFVREGETK